MGQGKSLPFYLPVASLSSLIAPLMTVLSSKNSLAFFTVSAVERTGAGKAPPRRLCHEVRHIVQQCTLPDLDVLLPYNSSVGNEGRSFLVAIADEIGAEVLARRLREQLQRWEHAQQTGLTFRVAYEFLSLPMPASRPSSCDLLQIVAGKIEQLISQELLKSDVSQERSCG